MRWSTVRKRMRRRREALGLTQEEAAWQCEVGRNSLGRWESGGVSPSVPNFLKWCKGLEVDPARMLAQEAPSDAG